MGGVDAAILSFGIYMYSGRSVSERKVARSSPLTSR